MLEECEKQEDSKGTGSGGEGGGNRRAGNVKSGEDWGKKEGREYEKRGRIVEREGK